VNAVPLRQMASHPGVTPGFSAADRLDPYWDGLWTNGSSAVWVSAELAERQVASGLARIPAHLSMTTAEATRILRSTKTRGARLSALGAMDQWRTLSGEQMAALTGWGALASPTSKILTAAFTAGVLDVGEFANPLARGTSADRSRLVRPTRSLAFDQVIAPDLTYQEWVSITGGSPWDFRRQYDRHNLISTEMGLRVAEFCEVGTVLGEKLSTADLLYWSGLGRTGECPDKRAADLTVVRADGLRIAVEVTASAGNDFAAKVRRWAHVLAGNSLASSGLVVLFVEAAPPGNSARASVRQRRVIEEVTKQVAKVVMEFPGTAGDRVASRIGVARWEDWFPSGHHVSPGFASLDAVRPTGPPGTAANPHQRWEPVSFLDPFDLEFEPHNPDAMTSVVANSSMLLGVPHWLRNASIAPPLWPLQMERLGLDELPASPPSRITRFTGARSALASGVPGVTSAPERMRVDVAGWPGAGR
jgi:hypothetical protein